MKTLSSRPGVEDLGRGDREGSLLCMEIHKKYCNTTHSRVEGTTWQIPSLFQIPLTKEQLYHLTTAPPEKKEWRSYKKPLKHFPYFAVNKIHKNYLFNTILNTS